MSDPALTLTIDALTSSGDGLGRVDGRVVFVPRTAPGDVVDARIVRRGSGGRFAIARLVDVRRAAESRITPRCPHFVSDACGGCQWQHIALPVQRAAKRERIADALQRVGRRAWTSPIELVHDDGDGFGYRRSLTVTVRDTARDAGARIGGLRRYDDPDAIFALDTCLLVVPAVQRAWTALRSHLDLLPASDHATSRSGRAELRVTLRAASDAPDAPVALRVSGGRWHDADRDAFAVAMQRALPTLARIDWSARGAAPVALLVAESARGATVAGFSQAHATLADALHAHVREHVLNACAESREDAPRDDTGTDVVDAYAGDGRLAVELAAHGMRVAAIERDAYSVARAEARVAEAGVGDRCDIRPVAVEAALEAFDAARVAVVNPPRTGLDAAVAARLEANAARPLRALVYVSCDPATLARDLARMPSWRLTDVRAFDMFPQTAHVETVCRLEPGAA